MRVAWLAIVAVLVLTTNGLAEMDHSKMHHGGDSGHKMMHHEDEHSGHMMKHGTKKAETDSNEAAKHDHQGMKNPRIDEINTHLEKLDFLVDEIDEAETPRDRRTLMRDHIVEMQGAVNAMQRMMWCCLPGGHHGGEAHGHHGMAHGEDMDRNSEQEKHQLNSIFQRLKVMQQLMGQIVVQQSLLLGEITTAGKD